MKWVGKKKVALLLIKCQLLKQRSQKGDAMSMSRTYLKHGKCNIVKMGRR